MLTKQERKTQKKLLAQRDEARAQVAALTSDVERLKGDVKVLAGEAIIKAERACAETVRALEFERDKAFRERDALLKDFDKAIAVHLNDTKKELEFTATKLSAAQREVLSLVSRNGKLTEELDAACVAKNMFEARSNGFKAELESLRMEDTKQLRKRLQAKSERLLELERELAKAKSAPIASPAPALPGLSAMLNAKLRRKLQQDGKTAGTRHEHRAPTEPVEPTPTPTAQP